MVLEAARAAEAGETRERILERLAMMRENMSLIITPATLKYLQMSGRVGGLQAALASVLSIKPIIRVEDGLLGVCGSVRTRSKALDRLLDMTEEAMGTADRIKVAVIHARSPEEGEGLLARVKARFNCQETWIGDLVSSLSVHGGPGILGIFAYKASVWS